MTVPLLSLENVTVRFPIGRRRNVTAVDNVDLELREGETVGLIGESGSGKSTVARAAMGLVPIAEGTVRWRGDDVSEFGARSAAPLTSPSKWSSKTRTAPWIRDAQFCRACGSRWTLWGTDTGRTEMRWP